MCTFPVSTAASLLGPCASTAGKVQDLLMLIGCLPVSHDTASPLAAELRKLRGAVSQLLQRLSSGSATFSDDTVDTMKSVLTAGDEILAGMGNSIRLYVSEPSQHPWNVQTAERYTRMVETQSQALTILLEVIELDNSSDRDEKLATSEALMLFHRGLKDAQSMREAVATSRPRTLSVPYGSMNCYPPAQSAPVDQAEKEVVEAVATLVRPSNASTASIRTRRTTTPTGHRSPVSRVFGVFRSSKDLAADPKILISDLCEACREGKYDWAQSLLDDGADANGLDERRSPPLYYAILRGDLRIVKLLVSHGAWVGGPDGQSSAMVLYAVLKGDISVLTYLLEESAPVSAACFDPLDRQRIRRTTPLLLAVEKGNVAAVRILLDHGADVHGSGNSKGLNPLCTAVDRRHPEVIKLLLKYEARINDRESTAPWASDVAAIHVASYRGYDEILGILLAAGADVSVTCQRGGATGVTALHLAGSSACVGKLMEDGAKPHTGDSNRQYPLSGAVQVGNVGAVRELVKRGAPVNAQDRRHETALHITSRLFARDAKAGNTEKLAAYRSIVQELLEGGANMGPKAAAHRIIRTECAKMLQGKESLKKAEKAERLELLELMAVIIELATLSTAAENAAPLSPGRRMFREMIEESALSQIVQRRGGGFGGS